MAEDLPFKQYHIGQNMISGEIVSPVPISTIPLPHPHPHPPYPIPYASSTCLLSPCRPSLLYDKKPDHNHHPITTILTQSPTHGVAFFCPDTDVNLRLKREECDLLVQDLFDKFDRDLSGDFRCLSTNPIPSTHPINAPYPINTHYQPILSTNPITHLLTHPINTPYQHYLLY